MEWILLNYLIKLLSINNRMGSYIQIRSISFYNFVCVCYVKNNSWTMSFPCRIHQNAFPCYPLRREWILQQRSPWEEPRQPGGCKSGCGRIWAFRVTIQNEFPCHITWSTRKSTPDWWKRLWKPSPEPIITLISPYLQTLSPVIPPARSVSGKPSTKCTRIHRKNTLRIFMKGDHSITSIEIG